MPAPRPRKFTDAALLVLAIAIAAALFEGQRARRTEELIGGVETQRLQLTDRKQRLERSRQTSVSQRPKPSPPAAAGSAAAASRGLRLQALQLDKWRADAQLDYGALFYALGLSPGQIGQFIELKIKYRQEIERIHAETAALKSSPTDPAVRRAAGPGGTGKDLLNRDLRAFTAKPASHNSISIKAPWACATWPINWPATSLLHRLPLSGPQAEQLTQILAANAVDKNGQINGWNLDWDTAIAQARGILSPTQIATFQTIKDNILWQRREQDTGRPNKLEPMPPEGYESFCHARRIPDTPVPLRHFCRRNLLLCCRRHSPRTSNRTLSVEMKKAFRESFVYMPRRPWLKPRRPRRWRQT